MRRILAAAGLVVCVCAVGASSAGTSAANAPLLVGLHLSNGASPFAGDGRLVTTISPNRDGFRDAALIRFRLFRIARVRMTVNRTTGRLRPVYSHAYRLGPGRHTLRWAPPASRGPRTYLVRLVATDPGRQSTSFGTTSAGAGPSPVIRVQGIDAAFRLESYRPAQFASVSVRTDAAHLEVQLFRSGTEWQDTRSPDVMLGTAATAPREIDWRWRSRPHSLRLYLPGRLESGLYFVRLTAGDDRVGFAPFVFGREARNRAGRDRPSDQTWEAYNFNDIDGNGWEIPGTRGRSSARPLRFRFEAVPQPRRPVPLQ